MNIIIDGFKVTKKDDRNIVLFDYQITDNNKTTICAIQLGEKRNKFLCCYHATNTMIDAIYKKAFCNEFTSVAVNRALKLAKIKRKELFAKNVVMMIAYKVGKQCY